eukprot:1183826-Prorocentrum_minimum.AAC.1
MERPENPIVDVTVSTSTVFSLARPVGAFVVGATDVGELLVGLAVGVAVGNRVGPAVGAELGAAVGVKVPSGSVGVCVWGE